MSETTLTATLGATGRPARPAERPWVRPLDRFGSLLLLAVLLALWELAAELRVVAPLLLGRPSIILTNLVRGLADGSLLYHAGVSLVSLLLGYTLAAVIGIPLGLLSGMHWRLGALLDPPVLLLYSAPLVAFYPLLLIWFGLGLGTVVALAFLLSVFPIVLNSALGARLTDQVLLRTAVSFGATPSDLFWRVVLPSAVPTIVSGMRLAAGRAVVGVIAGEFFGANAGLGFLISNAGTKLRTNDLLVGVILAALLGLAIAQLVALAERRVNRRMGRG